MTSKYVMANQNLANYYFDTGHACCIYHLMAWMHELHSEFNEDRQKI